MFELSGKAALVTGGGTGIGRSCALALAAAGADVMIADLDEAHAQETASAIESLGRRALFVRCDVTDPQDVAEMVKTTAAAFGKLDIALNNAGIFARGEDFSHSLEEWERVLRTNLSGVWLCAKAEADQMRKQSPPGGKIINMGSLGATLAISNGSYDAAKAGVVQLSRVFAARLGRYNINVNCLSPGYVTPVFGRKHSS